MDGLIAPQIMKLPSSLSLHYSWSWITVLNCTLSPPSAHTILISHRAQCSLLRPWEGCDRTSPFIFQKSFKLLINYQSINTISQISRRAITGEGMVTCGNVKLVVSTSVLLPAVQVARKHSKKNSIATLRSAGGEAFSLSLHAARLRPRLKQNCLL